MSIKWEVSGKELRLIEPTGNIRVPSVDEIYVALVERKPTEEGMPTSVAGLRVSRYPLVPRLVIDKDSDGIPKYSLTAKCRSLFLPLDLPDLERGHVILDSTWYPIDSPTGSEVAELLRDTGGELGPVQSLKSFLHVRKAAAAGGPVDDITATLSISPSVSIVVAPFF